MPSSEVSGVRSSCEAVATNARRASSCWRSRCCMVASVRDRSPTSSWARSTGTSTIGPPSASSRAASRRRLRRRTSRAERGMPRIRVSAKPASAASKNARRTTPTTSGISPMDLRTARTYRRPSLLMKGIAARAYSCPSMNPNVYCGWSVRNAVLTSLKGSSASEGSCVGATMSSERPGGMRTSTKRASSRRTKPFWSRCRRVRFARSAQVVEIRVHERLERALPAQVGLQRRLLGVAQALLERAQQRQRRHGQRGHGGDENHAHDPTAQTEGAVPR